MTARYNPNLILIKREIGIKQESKSQYCWLLKRAKVSNLTIIAAQKARLTNKRSEIVLIRRFIGRGARKKIFIGELDILI
jgi:hypothetical protein